MSNGFRPSFRQVFTTTHPITGGLTRIERTRGFLEAAMLSEQWVQEMGRRALLLEAHHTTHIEGTRLVKKRPSRRRVDDVRPGELYRTHQGHPTAHISCVAAAASRRKGDGEMPPRLFRRRREHPWRSCHRGGPLAGS